MQTTATLAAALDTTPRTLRKFLRSADSGIDSVGKGSRYTLPSTKREVNALTKRFNAWQEGQDAKKAPKVIDEAPAAPEVEDAPEVEVEGPTDEEIMALEDIDLDD